MGEPTEGELGNIGRVPSVRILGTHTALQRHLLANSRIVLVSCSIQLTERVKCLVWIASCLSLVWVELGIMVCVCVCVDSGLKALGGYPKKKYSLVRG